MILHIDMDAFYASVEERENPELVGKPLVVGGQPEDRGVVAAANYAAREFGIFSAMPMATAVRKCPDLQIVKPRGALYSEVSGEIRAIFSRYTPVIEPLSLDEAFLDPSGSERLYQDAETIGRNIKCDIRNELGLVASVGVAPNKFLAKLASDFEKPDGFTVIEPDKVQQFLDPLPVWRIWGVGKVARKKLNAHNIRLISDLRSRDQAFFDDLFGQYGAQLWRLAHGIDERKVTPDTEAKSVSQETTFGTDITNFRALESTVLYLAESVAFRLRDSSIKGRTVTMKLRFDDFRTITRSRSLELPTNKTDEIWHTAQELLSEALGQGAFAIRLAGVGVSGFDEGESRQMDLFVTQDDSNQDESTESLLDSISDDIRKKYGRDSIKRGKSIR